MVEEEGDDEDDDWTSQRVSPRPNCIFFFWLLPIVDKVLEAVVASFRVIRDEGDRVVKERQH
jgi:hypothetical protein